MRYGADNGTTGNAVGREHSGQTGITRREYKAANTWGGALFTSTLGVMIGKYDNETEEELFKE